MNGEAQRAYKKLAALQKEVITLRRGEMPHPMKPGRTKGRSKVCEKSAMDSQHPTDPKSPNTMASPASVTGIAGATNSLGGITGQTEEDMMLTPAVPGPEKQAAHLGEVLVRNCVRNSIK